MNLDFEEFFEESTQSTGPLLRSYTNELLFQSDSSPKIQWNCAEGFKRNYEMNSLTGKQSRWFSCIHNEWEIMYECSEGINEITGYCESDIDPEPSDCVGIKSSTDRLLCMKLNKILENQEVIFENQEEIFDLISFWQQYISGMKRP